MVVALSLLPGGRLAWSSQRATPGSRGRGFDSSRLRVTPRDGWAAPFINRHRIHRQRLTSDTRVSINRKGGGKKAKDVSGGGGGGGGGPGGDGDPSSQGGARRGVMVAVTLLTSGAATRAATSYATSHTPYLIHIVAPGDTLSEIALDYYTTVTNLRKANGLMHEGKGKESWQQVLVEGQRLKVPVNGDNVHLTELAEGGAATGAARRGDGAKGRRDDQRRSGGGTSSSAGGGKNDSEESSRRAAGASRDKQPTTAATAAAAKPSSSSSTSATPSPPTDRLRPAKSSERDRGGKAGTFGLVTWTIFCSRNTS
jgi:LysM repeat protein